MQRYRPLAYLVILGTLAGLVLAGWLIGHVLRYSLPALWHPPVPEMEPGVMNGFEYEGIRRLARMTGDTLILVRGSGGIFRVSSGEIWGNALEECLSSTFFTSLPAKCRTADGRLVRVGGIESRPYILPPLKNVK